MSEPLEHKRLFVGNLPHSISEDRLKNFFSTFGEVVSVELRSKPEQDKTFAYLNVNATETGLNSCLDRANKTCWDGKELSVQLAREDFLKRLANERNEKTDAERLAKTANFETLNVDSERILSKKELRKQKKYALKPIGYDLIKKSGARDNSSSTFAQPKPLSIRPPRDSRSLQSQSSSGSNCIPLGMNKMTQLAEHEEVRFENKRASRPERSRTSFESWPEKQTAPTVRDSVAPSVPIVPVIDPEAKRALDNQKRLESLQSIQNQKQSQSDLIKQALTADKPLGKKIVFDDDFFKKQTSGEDQTDKPIAQTKKKSLFDDDGYEENFDIEAKVNSGVKGRKSEKLIELQSRFSHDPRFRVTEKFVDSDHDGENEEEAGFIEEGDETEKNLDILGSVLGRAVSRVDKRIDKARVQQIPRFDPTAPEAEKYELKRKAREVDVHDKKSDKAANKKQKVVKEVIERPLVSTDRYYEVNPGLKNAFGGESSSGTQSFSLSTMFGSSDAANEAQMSRANDNDKAYKAEKYLKENLKNQRNPFKYDSSASEDESHEPIRAKNSKISFDGSQSSPSLFQTEKFFFTNDDARLQEDSFFNQELIGRAKEKWPELRQKMIEVVARRKRFVKRKKQLENKIQTYNMKKRKAGLFKKKNAQKKVSKV